MNGSIRGTIHLHKLPRFKEEIIQRPRDEFEEFGEGSLDVTEFLPSQDTSDSFEEESVQWTLPRSSAEPFDRKQKPLRHFMSVGDQREIQTEYRPGYRRLIAQQSASPPRLSVNRSRWSMSQSVRSLNPPPPRDHLLRCVACWLKSTQCQNCVDGVTTIDQLAPRDTPASPQSLSLPRNNPTNKIASKGLPLPAETPRQRKIRSKSQPRGVSMPSAETSVGSSSRRIRQHTFSSAISVKPSPINSRKPSRGFHFINAQPSDLQRIRPQQTPSAPQRAQAQSGNSVNLNRTNSLRRNQKKDIQQLSANRIITDDDPLSVCGYYPKISSPVETEDHQNERDAVFIHITSDTRIPPSGEIGFPTFSCWELEDQILYIDGH